MVTTLDTCCLKDATALVSNYRGNAAGRESKKMGYEPGVITTLANTLQTLDRVMPGYGFWYGELGRDTELAKMILDGTDWAELKAWVIDTYGDDPEEL